jgi:parvulin-like peptidyl-prolyl isomerase
MDWQMKTMLYRKALTVLVGVVLATFGCNNEPKTGKFTEEQMVNLPLPKKDGLPEPSGGLVLNVGAETITTEEIIEPAVKAYQAKNNPQDFEKFKANVWPKVAEAVLEKTTNILMYHEAKKSAPSDIDQRLDKVVEQEVNRFVARYEGNYAEAQKVIEEMGMDWDDFRDYIKRSILIESYNKKATRDKLITHRELVEYYNAVKEERFKIEGMIEFRLIDIDSSKIVAEEGTSAKETALKLGRQLLESINRGEDFGELAKEYSHGHRAPQGGLWTPATAGALAEPYDVVEQRCLEMEPGKISGPVVSGKHVFIIRLENKRQEGYEPFEDVQRKIENEIQLKHRIEEGYDKTVSRVMEQADIPKLEEFISYCVEQAYLRIKVNQ